MSILESEDKYRYKIKPEEAIGIPIAEVDESVIEDTFCVISRSWGQTYVHRYTRLPTLYAFDPYSSVRRAAIAFTTHICYDICMMIIIFANLIDLAIPNSLPLLFVRVSLIFYLAEALHETVARGFIFGSYAYLKNPWMCLDFIITLLSLPDLELDVNSSFGIQSLRGIRVFNLISKIPGVQTMMQAVLLSMFRMYGVALIVMLFLLAVALTAKQLFMGIFWRKCVKDLPSNFSNLNISYEDYINNFENWHVDEHHDYVMCGNATGAQKCLTNFTCLNTIVNAPDSDITSFDTFSLSMINSFRLLTQDEWETIYDAIIEASGPLNIFFFVPVIFLGSFFLLNLMLVVVTSTFDSIMKSKDLHRPLRSHRYDSSFRFDVQRLSLHLLPTSPGELKRVLKERDEILEHHKWIKKYWQKIVSMVTFKLAMDKTDHQHEDFYSMTGWKKFRSKLKVFSDSKAFHSFTVLIIIFNTALLSAEHARMSKEFRLTLRYCNVVVTCLFTLETMVYLISYGKYYFFNWWNILDFFIVVQSIISVVSNIFAEYTILRSLRLMELMKVQQAWPALQRVISVVLSSVRNILKLLFVMVLIIFTFAVIGNRVLGYLFKNNVEIPRWSFLTFGGSLFTVFEIFAGEWYEPLSTCMAASKIPLLCIVIIIPYYIVGYLVILSVFTAVLLGAFDASALKLPKLRVKREPKFQESVNESTSENEASPLLKHTLFSLRRCTQSTRFQYFIMILIVGSSITMAFEDSELHHFTMRKQIIHYLNLAFTILFIIEMLLRWIAIGIEAYFADSWMRFDFILVLLSIIELFIITVFNISDHTKNGLKALRALRPLRIIPRWKGLQLVVHSLVLSLPAIFHVVLVVLFIWLPFAILGVHFFSGKFFRCVDKSQERLYEEIHDKADCLEKGYMWEDMFYNFNHIGNSYLSLFQLALFTGWADLVEIMVDFNDDVDLQPIRDNKPQYYIFVVTFVFLGSFFSLHMFVGVAVDTFKRSQKHVKMNKAEGLLTDSQRRYYGAMLRLGKKKPVMRTDRPTNKILNICYTITYSLWFRVIILVFICANTITISVESHNDPPKKTAILHKCDLFFTVSYTIEFAIKILGLRKFYFLDFWNIFDCVLLFIHIIGDMFPHDKTMSNPLSFLYAYRLLRILRLLRLTDMLIDLRRLIHSMVASIPALINISILLFLVIYIYSILGMSFFGHLVHHGIISSKVNFETFVHSYLLLFRLTTAQGWEEVMESLSTQPPFCSKKQENCGNRALSAVFLLSFIIISNIILVNIFIAVILDNYLEAIMQENDVINDDNLASFYRLWKQFDPKATQFISFEQLSDFLDMLNKDMRIPKPNQIAIVYMNLPIAEGNKVHCFNVLKGIMDLKVGDVEDSTTFRILCDEVQKKYDKMFPKLKKAKFMETTMQLKRREFAARVIQTNLKKMRERKIKNV